MSTDQAHRDRVRREALAAGHSEEEAALIASAQGVDTRTPQRYSQRDATPKPLSRTLTSKPQARASTTTGTRSRLSAMCALYGAQVLVADLERARVPLCRVASLLEEAKSGAGLIGPAGLARIRFNLSL